MSGAEIAKVAWLEPWSPVVDSQHASRLERELAKEVARGHALFGRVAKAVAVRGDQDDVLFAVANPDQLAVVHLTWSSGADYPLWPTTSFFRNVAEFAEARMKPDHEDFEFAG
jgi:hypothetical protein